MKLSGQFSTSEFVFWSHAVGVYVLNVPSIILRYKTEGICPLKVLYLYIYWGYTDGSSICV